MLHSSSSCTLSGSNTLYFNEDFNNNRKKKGERLLYVTLPLSRNISAHYKPSYSYYSIIVSGVTCM